MLDWNDLRYFLAVAARRQHARGRPRRCASARRPSRGRIAALEAALGSRCSRNARRAMPSRRGRGAGRARRAGRTRRERLCRSRGGNRPRPQRHRADHHRRRSSRSPCWRRCCASSTNGTRRSSSSSTTARTSATLARAKPTSRCAAPLASSGRRTRRPPPVRATSGRFIAAATMPRAHGVPTTQAQLKKHAFIGGGGGNLWRAYSAWLEDLGLERPGRDAPRARPWA